MYWLDPDYLPETRGKLNRFILNPHGDIDGLLLVDGTEIHTPPHLLQQLSSSLKSGCDVSVRGVKPLAGDVVVAIAVGMSDGSRLVDRGPEHADKKHKPPHPPKEHRSSVEHRGTIMRLLHGPKGQPHGALLMDDVIVRFPPHSAVSFASILKSNATLSVRGTALSTAHGTVIDAHAMGSDFAHLIERSEPPNHGPKKPKGPHAHHPHHPPH